MSQKLPLAARVLALFACLLVQAHAAATTVLTVDLPGLIEQFAQQPERFAVEVPHQFSPTAQGEWTAQGSVRTWKYSVQIPTAVSLSFHASRLALPPGATLTVTGSQASVTYRAQDVSHGVLWGRPLVGDTLTFALAVSSSESSAVRFDVDSLQAGYRGLGGLPSHPHYMQLLRAKTATVQSCQENYSCDATTVNSGPAHSIVAIVVGNQLQCTGTLLNNTSGDLTPYVLTARHCENGTLGGGAPQAAGSITIYWDAVAPCGAALGSIYDGSAPVQFGASTVVEQQDAWLIRLDRPPVVTDAYWAGWDATGSTFVGGYSIHHALGFDKQYVGWYGQALLQQIPAATLKLSYDSTFWGLVNQVGSVGAGASGGAVFDANDRVTGSASLAALQNGPDSAGVCPATPATAPAPSTITAQYTALSAVFSSTADSTSTTGATTIRTVLDPGATGKMVLDGVGMLPVTLTADQTSLTTFQTLTLSWNAAGAQSCTATGGVAGDGWAGSKPASGTAKITNYPGGTVSYTLACTGGDLAGRSTVSVDWIYIAPSISLSGPTTPVMFGGDVFLLWDANVSPCVASGGIAGDGWPGSKTNPGQQTVSASQLGTINYILTCGTGPRSATIQTSIQVVPLSVTLTADSTTVRKGSEVTLHWIGAGSGDNCSGAGGAAGDGWAQQIALQSSGMAYVTENTAGTYTYTLNCAGGGQSASPSVTVVFTDGAPSIALSAVSATEEIFPQLTPITPPTDLLWSSNVTQCLLSASGVLGNTSVTLQGQYPSGSAADAQFMAGLYTYTLQCGSLQTSTTIQWTTSHPTVTLTAPTTTWVANYPYQLFWSTNTEPCTETGGVTGDGWAGNYSAGQAAPTVTETLPGTYTFTLTCGIGNSTGQAQLHVTVPPPSASIQASSASTPPYSVITLSWNSTVAPCTSVDASGGTNWGGNNISPAGSIPVIETTPGTYTYSITCGTGSQTVHASTQVVVAATQTKPTTISASENSVAVNTPVTLTWASAPSAVCTAVGGNGSDGWNGTQAASGSVTVESATAATVTYGINCDSGSAQTQVTYTAPSNSFPSNPTPSVVLTSDKTAQTAGQGVTLTWTSQNSNACTGSGGTASDGWTGNLPLSGSMQVTEPNAGAATYAITCTGAPPAAVSQVTVNFTSATSSSSGGGGGSTGSGGGGGGGLDRLSLLLLALTLGARMRSRRQCMHSVSFIDCAARDT